MLWIIGLVIVFIVIIFIISHIKFVPQSNVYIIESFGTYKCTWKNGPHFLTPFVDRIVKKISLKEFVIDFKPQAVITKDNVTMQIDTVVFYQVTDPKLYTYGVDRPLSAIENLTATTLRNIIGDLELDATLTSRDLINTSITATLDQSTDRWGIKINRVELKNIIPPSEIQNAMEKQMKAERERRETMLRAEGEKKSSILIAEGQKASRILAAEADKETEILRAQAEQAATILQAEAIKEKQIREAQGEAEAIETVQKALAKSLVMLNQAAPTDEVLKLKGLETFAKVADGKATKIIIPSEIQNLAGLLTSAKEIMSSPNSNN